MNIEIVKIQTGNNHYPVAHEIRIDGRAFHAPVELSDAERIKSNLENDAEYLQSAIKQLNDFDKLQTARMNFSGYSELVSDVKNAFERGQYKNLISAASDIISKRGLQNIVSAEKIAWAAAE